MSKKILITGSTDGIGLETAKMLATAGHRVLLHGRNADKLSKAAEIVKALGQTPETFLADLSSLEAVSSFADAVLSKHDTLDALINNAGIYGAPDSAGEVDLRFIVNTVSPYLLTMRLLPILEPDGRVVNVSSAAQAPVNLSALQGGQRLSDSAAYAQTKLAITMWTMELAKELGDTGPAIIAVNPASMLGSKMVKEAYGVSGGDLRIGADILIRAAIDPAFKDASGKYYDNDRQTFATPQADATNADKRKKVIRAIASLTSKWV